MPSTRSALMGSPPEIHYSNHFASSAQTLASVEPLARAGIVAAIRYLRTYGRSAVAPDVRWKIQQSVFRDHSGEIRWPIPERQERHPSAAWRGLFVTATDLSWIVFTLLGNKAVGPASANSWYDVAVPTSDDVARNAKQILKLRMFPAEV